MPKLRICSGCGVEGFGALFDLRTQVQTLARLRTVWPKDANPSVRILSTAQRATHQTRKLAGRGMYLPFGGVRYG